MELFEHNRKAYEAVKKEFSEGVQRTCVVHPTGTGKSYIEYSGVCVRAVRSEGNHRIND